MATPIPAQTLDTLGPFFQPLLSASTKVAEPILGSYDRFIGNDSRATANLILAVCLAATIRAIQQVYVIAQASGYRDRTAKAHANGNGLSDGKKKAKEEEQDEKSLVASLGALHFAYVGILALAAARSAPLSGDLDSDESRSLALIVALGLALHQALQWFLDDEPAPVALAATNHVFGFTVGLFPLGGASRHLKAAAATRSAAEIAHNAKNAIWQANSASHLPAVPVYDGVFVGRALLNLGAFFIVVALTAMGLSLGRWEQFRRLEMHIATVVLAFDIVALSIIEFL